MDRNRFLDKVVLLFSTPIFGLSKRTKLDAKIICLAAQHGQSEHTLPTANVFICMCLIKCVAWIYALTNSKWQLVNSWQTEQVILCVLQAAENNAMETLESPNLDATLRDEPNFIQNVSQFYNQVRLQSCLREPRITVGVIWAAISPLSQYICIYLLPFFLSFCRKRSAMWCSR